MKVYHIFRDGIQQDCCWFRYRNDANKRLREYWRPNKEKIKAEEFDSLDEVPSCDVVGGLSSERCANCWRKLKIDWLNHIKINDMKKENYKGKECVLDGTPLPSESEKEITAYIKRSSK